MPIEKLFDECRQSYYENKYCEAIDICDEILKHDFNNQRAIGYKARCLYLLEEFGEALTLLNNALILYPDNDYFLSLKADVFMHNEEYGKAVECFEEILEMEISDEDDLNYIKREYGTCLSLRIDQLIEMENYVDAWQCYSRMLEIESEYGVIRSSI